VFYAKEKPSGISAENPLHNSCRPCGNIVQEDSAAA
jgi:hypothetical protein